MSDKNITCTCCGKEKNANQGYYSSETYVYKNLGRMSVCKECIWDYVITEEDNGYDIRRMKDILQMIDKPFIQSLLEASEAEALNGNKNAFKVYMKNIVLRQNRKLRWMDGDLNTVGATENLGKDDIIPIDVNDLSDEAMKRWKGFKLEEAKLLEDFYQELLNNYEHGTPIQKNLYKNIAIVQMKAEYAISEGKNKEYKDLMDTLSKLMNDANIKPVQETGAENSSISSFGEFIKMIEETEPIPEPRDEFKDVDGIKKYVDKWFVHHFSRVFGLSNDSMEEYDRKLAEREAGDS